MKIKTLLLSLLLFASNVFAVAVINEGTQYLDTNGKPIVNGYIYIGEQNQNPVTNPITIYSDRNLSTTISNPQRTDSYGRSENKIWVPGRYSIRVDNSSSVQKYIDLDRGDDPPTGTTKLTNVQGTNTITAEGAGTLVDGQTYIFQAVGDNTSAVTLNIDNIGAYNIVHFPGVNIGSGAIFDDEYVTVVWDSTNTEFQLINPSPQNSTHIIQAEGAAVASATTPNIWSTDGDTIHITGTTQIDDFTDAPQAGAKKTLIFDSTLTLTSGSGITVKGGTYVTTTGDYAEIYADDVDAFNATIFKADGTPTADVIITGTEQATTSGTAFNFPITGSPSIVTVTLEGVSLTGTDNILIQLKGSGSLETSGYVSESATIAAGGVSVPTSTSGFIVPATAAGSAVTATYTLVLSDSTNNTWVGSFGGRINTTNVIAGGGHKSITGALTQVTITRTGSNTFDAGAANTVSQ